MVSLFQGSAVFCIITKLLITENQFQGKCKEVRMLQKKKKKATVRRGFYLFYSTTHLMVKNTNLASKREKMCGPFDNERIANEL